MKILHCIHIIAFCSIWTFAQSEVQYKAVIFNQPYLNAAIKSSSCGRMVGYGYNIEGKNDEKPLLWNGQFSNPTTISTPGYTLPFILGVTFNYMGGYGYASDNAAHALLIEITSGRIVDLHPSGRMLSYINDVFDNIQVGIVDGHAYLWKGSAESGIDLNPNGYIRSEARCVSGEYQAGSGERSESVPHALLWRGSAATVVDLQPSWPYIYSVGNGVQPDGNVVGVGVIGNILNPNDTGNRAHALLWSGNRSNYIDLHPGLYDDSVAYACSKGKQVGKVSQKGKPSQAVLWFGSSDTMISLHQFLPAGHTASLAQSIDEFGNIAGIAISNGITRAVLWIPSQTYDRVPSVQISIPSESGDKVRLQLRIDPGHSYSIQTTTNMSQWSNILTSNTQEILSYADCSNPKTNNLFYRISVESD